MHKFIVVIGNPEGPALAGPGQWQAHRADALLGLAGLRRLVRSDVHEVVRRDHAAPALQPITIVEELWFDAEPHAGVLETLLRPCASLTVLQASRVREHVVFRRPAADLPCVKRLSFLQRRAGMSLPEFSRYWEHVHAPLAHCHRHVALYVQNHVLDPLSEALFDGMAEFQITDPVGMQADYASEPGRLMRADVTNFAATVSTYFVTAQEFRTAT